MRLWLRVILGSAAVSVLAVPMALGAVPEADSAFGLSSASTPTAVPVAQPASSVADAYAPQRMAIVDEPESVYPQASAPHTQEPLNSGSVSFDLTISYLSRYVFRGVDQATLPGHSENALQFKGEAEFDLGRLPHPFVGLFVNVFNSDPVSRFEEVRPVLGLRWLIKPLTITTVYNAYIFPNRKDLDTQEVALQFSLDDSRLWNTDKPILSPYVLAAYDFERYFGVYLELGLKHDFVIEETGITLTPSASVAYTIDDKYFAKDAGGTGTGAQHFEVGLTLNYSLNNLLNISRRFGQWNIQGYLFDDGPINSELRADTRLFGGAGIDFKY
jgi:hypothetical protein